jgi:hypothetical protein
LDDPPDEPFGRALYERGVSRLLEGGVLPLVWIDHGNEGNVQNFGSYNPLNASRYQQGDDPGAAGAYHTDVTLGALGVRYAWYSRHSSQYAFDFPATPKSLRDGRRVWAFGRYTGEGGAKGVQGLLSALASAVRGGAGGGADATGAGGEGGLDWQWYPDRIHDEITIKRLETLVTNGQYGLFAQHLGIGGGVVDIPQQDVEALGLLREWMYDRHELLVARTSRLLQYATMRRYVRYEVRRDESAGAGTEGGAAEAGGGAEAAGGAEAGGGALGAVVIDIKSIEDPLFPDPAPTVERLRGLTFYCEDPYACRILINGAPVPEDEVKRNAIDDTAQASISIRWFAPDYHDRSLPAGG